jgi:hypothetical protein
MENAPMSLAVKTSKSTLAALRKYKTAATPPPVFVSLFSGYRRDSTATPGDTRDTLPANPAFGTFRESRESASRSLSLEQTIN